MANTVWWTDEAKEKDKIKNPKNNILILKVFGFIFSFVLCYYIRKKPCG